MVKKKNEQTNDKSAFAFKTSFTTKLNPVAIEDYTDFFTSIGVPSASKLGVVFDIIHAYPMFNGNGHGFMADVLKKSANTFLNSLIDVNHDRNCIVGSIVKVDIIENDISPLTIRLVGVLDKQILRDWGIDDLLDEDWSMETLYSLYCYSIGNKIYQPNEIPEIDARFSEINEGKPVYDKLGNRVCLLFGGLDGEVDFNRCGLIIWGEGADPLAQTHLQVANKKQNNQSNKEGENMPFKTFETEKEYNEAVAQIKSDYKTELKFDQLQNDLQTSQASLQTKDNEITDFKGKLETANASLATEKERADKAESELAKQATAALITERKQLLASKNYPEDRIAKKEEWLGKASKEEFDNFVEEVDALFASATKSFQSKAEQLGMKEAIGSLFTITGQGSEQENKDEKGEVVIF